MFVVLTLGDIIGLIIVAIVIIAIILMFFWGKLDDYKKSRQQRAEEQEKLQKEKEQREKEIQEKVKAIRTKRFNSWLDKHPKTVKLLHFLSDHTMISCIVITVLITGLLLGFVILLFP